MSDSDKPQDGAATPRQAFVAILAAVAVASVMLMIIGSVSDVGSREANAAPAVLSAPDQVVSPEEYSAFVRQGHTRAALEGDDAPLPPTF